MIGSNILNWHDQLGECESRFEKFGGPGQIFISGALFFPKMLAKKNGPISVKFGPISVKFRSTNFSSYHYLYQKTFQIIFLLIVQILWPPSTGGPGQIAPFASPPSLKGSDFTYNFASKKIIIILPMTFDNFEKSLVQSPSNPRSCWQHCSHSSTWTLAILHIYRNATNGLCRNSVNRFPLRIASSKELNDKHFNTPFR
jgi:hypothetical protein